jgi:hypothetical protein
VLGDGVGTLATGGGGGVGSPVAGGCGVGSLVAASGGVGSLVADVGAASVIRAGAADEIVGSGGSLELALDGVLGGGV